MCECRSVNPPIAVTFSRLQHLAYLSKDSLLIAQLPTVSHSLVDYEFHFWTFSSFFSRLTCLSVKATIRQLPSQLKSILHLAYLSKDLFLFQKLPKVSHSLVDCEFHFWTFSSFFSRLACLNVESNNPSIAVTVENIQHLADLSKDSLLIAQLPTVSHSLVDCEFHFWTFSSFFSRLACLSVEVLIRQLPSQLRACYILHTCSKTCF